MRHLIRSAAIVSLCALGLQACATGEGVSFATSVGDGGSASPAADEAAVDASTTQPDSGYMATSGNAILPGGLFNPAGPGLGGSGLAGAIPGLGSNGLTALASATTDITLSGPNGPGVVVTPNVAVAGVTTASPLAPVAGGVNSLTGGASGALLGSVGGTVPALAVGNGVTPSLAGQPVTLLSGTTPVLNAAAPVTNVGGAIVAPVTSTLVNSAATAAAPTTSGGSGSGGSGSGGSGSGASTASGLGGLAQLIPPLLARP